MLYRVIFLKGDTVLGNTPWHDKQAAERFARDHLPSQRTVRGADSAEVRDISGNIVFKYSVPKEP